MGCLSERYLKDLQMEIPQVDKFYGKFNWNELLADLGKAYHSEFAIERHLTTPKHYAYLKYQKVATASVLIAPFLSLPVNMCLVLWKNSGRSALAGFRRGERISGHCTGTDLLRSGFV